MSPDTPEKHPLLELIMDQRRWIDAATAQFELMGKDPRTRAEPFAKAGKALVRRADRVIGEQRKSVASQGVGEC